MFGRLTSRIHSVLRQTISHTFQRSFITIPSIIVTKPHLSSFIVNKVSSLNQIQFRSFHVKKQTNRKKLTKNYKLKTHRATAKRFWVSGSGKILHMTRGKRHRMRNKSARQLRRMSHKKEVPKALRERYKKSIPYLF